MINECPPPGQAYIPTPPLFQVNFPALLQGARCYTDAAIAPDQANQHMRKAGLGVFILEPRRKLMIHIKAIATANSVIMAEAAAISLAGTILSTMQIQDVFFLTDNQQMVRFFNGSDHSDPPH